MGKHDKNPSVDSLEMEVLEMLAEAQQPVEIPEDMSHRIKSKLMGKIKPTQSNSNNKVDDFLTVFDEDDKGWIEAKPGGYVKILKGDISKPQSVMSYLVKLEPGFTMEGHDHPFDEETLMLEGDLTLGDITLNAGDFHFAKAGAIHGKVSTKNGCMAFMRGALPV